MEIDIPNPNGNSLIIKSENLLIDIGKLVGLQDLKVDNPIFDKTFLLQSNNPPFFEQLLTPEIQRQILETHAFYPGVYEFKPDIRHIKRPRKIVDQEEILDMHLIAGQEQKNPEKLANALVITPLIYTSKIQKSMSQDYDLITKLLRNVFTTNISLATRIYKHNYP